MDPRDIFRLLRTEPFRPFRIHLDDGKCHAVNDPKHVFVSASDTIVGWDHDEHGLPTKSAYFHPCHVVRVEPLEADRSLGTSAPLPSPPSEAQMRRAIGEHGVEFVGGRLCAKPDSVRAAIIRSRMLTLLSPTTKPAGALLGSIGYRCFSDDPLKFRKPDVSFVRTDRLPPEADDLDLLPMPPDLAVEIPTRQTLSMELEGRVADYLAAGFGTVWVVWPNVRIVRVHRPGESSREFRGDDEITGEPFLPAFRCPVRAFFK